MNPSVSYVSKKKVEKFISNYPIVREIGIGDQGLIKLQEIALKKIIPFSGILSSVYTFLNFKPVKKIEANDNEYLMYNLSDFAFTQVQCAIRNNE